MEGKESYIQEVRYLQTKKSKGVEDTQSEREKRKKESHPKQFITGNRQKDNS
ncbi:unnamed protein product [Tuber melanosporum]|uniref:(Perigord truffle) hypothetical protein n=1 Tax=Tuber melanosporum (strain Mel28) TaxID=656061 RepID=D5GJ58_TUBMM|nr:uncharacterized protein GSTUM_00008848001 [Tuber melanosporum]CAZ84551.1 unnamed protein product [Tuber melanosporum]